MICLRAAGAIWRRPLSGVYLSVLLGATHTVKTRPRKRQRLVVVFLATFVTVAAPSNAAPEKASGHTSRELGPRAVFDSTRYDFGVAPPKEPQEHTFLVRNEGDAPLTVKQVATSCKCVVTEMPEGPIVPGQSARITAGWFGRVDTPDYSQTITLKTNDPRQEIVELRVVGTIAFPVTFRPNLLSLRDVLKGQPYETSAEVVSTTWEHFEIKDIDAETHGYTHRLEPLDADELRRAGAKSGYRLHLTMGEGRPVGEFQESIKMSVHPPNDSAAATGTENEAENEAEAEAEPFDIYLPIFGKVSGRISVIGKDVQNDGTVRAFADRKPGARTTRLMVKVRDPKKGLGLVGFESAHPGLTARLEPLGNGLDAKGLHYLYLDVEGLKFKQSRMGDRAIALRLEFEHPRIERLELKVEVVLEDSVISGQGLPGRRHTARRGG
ncbi:hypothetical protein Mal64_19600 [Pseudobythopirellula maris]|uniref:DUF1573 domain-containing protein n=1 Tax=Pseudobythopirellula maris TaxID=2527991 RepID=A0A5C5ZNI6_9BACT|nr:DUF1573 domain-containing protein [Pseudobythopirellula maris]TWT88477.1 hypothetical protein Mal64_19600 [Pseudobythopirellula maris]